MNFKGVILIAEDSPTQAAKLKYLLTNDGYNVISAPNGKVALNKIYEQEVDLVISDIVMPEMNGCDLCNAIKEDNVIHSVPVLLLTSVNESDYLFASLKAGADFFITKPYKDDVLLSKVNVIITNYRKGVPVIGDKEKTLCEFVELLETKNGIKKAYNFFTSTFNYLKEQNQFQENSEGKLREVNESLSKVLKDITDSINYAKSIQRALLPKNNEIKSLFPESFILFKPRDIVSGDFYWLAHRDKKTYFALADCTGHGVPGGFMSMLGIAYLDEIIGNNPAIRADELLNTLRHNVIVSLHHSEEMSQSKDGMDISLIIVDWDKNEIEYSGAYSSLYLIRNKQLNEYKGDKMPIGLHIRKQPFKMQIIPFLKGDSFYLFTDGYVDQFGGPNNKKFKHMPLKNLLLNIAHMAMSEQYEILDNKIEEWKGDSNQVDDITMAGIHFGEKTLEL
jgi:DNA-binding response OmpR family regulator